MATSGNVAPTYEWINDPQGLFGLARRIVVGKNWTDLPTELKMKIVESLDGVSIARVSCVCTEIRNMASGNNLWKQKFLEEFADRETEEEMKEVDDWKITYVGLWRLTRNLGRRRRGRVSCNPWYEDIEFGARDWNRRPGSGSRSAAMKVLNLS